MSARFIFTMRRVSRFRPPDKEVLKDITLAFYPGAKIGVLGPNGAGKSSLLRIMAGAAGTGWAPLAGAGAVVGPAAGGADADEGGAVTWLDAEGCLSTSRL